MTAVPSDDLTPLVVRPSARLVSFTPEPEVAVARAARLCYSPAGYADVSSRIVPAE